MVIMLLLCVAENLTSGLGVAQGEAIPPATIT